MGTPGPTELLIVFLLALIGIVILLVLLRSSRSNDTREAEDRNARQILDERYARGELEHDEYQQMRRDMED
jgi:putative membrane protein